LTKPAAAPEPANQVNGRLPGRGASRQQGSPRGDHRELLRAHAEAEGRKRIDASKQSSRTDVEGKIGTSEHSAGRHRQCGFPVL
jgi:hypothetical protein